MSQIRVYFATNRDPKPPTGKPEGFGHNFSSNGLQDLRFGQAMVENGKIISLDVLPDAPGDGSKAMMTEIRNKMAQNGRDTLIMVHGYNTTFEAAIVGAAKTKEAYSTDEKALNVVMFTWPSDGKWGPLNPGEYANDRHDAAASGPAFAKGLLKLASFLREGAPCGQRTFLLTHSMGNFVLSNTLASMPAQSPTGRIPRLFDVIFSMAADEDYDAFDRDDKWAHLPELGGQVLVYINARDKALLGSDITKGNPDRMGNVGPKRPMDLPAKVSVIDVTKIEGMLDLGHGYYDTMPQVINDVKQVMAGKQGEDVQGRNWVPARMRYFIG
jgi:esterase/lipase superfamily enzyme